MTKALLIDFDGVLRLWDGAHDREVEQSSGLPPGALLATAFAPELLLPAITGAVSDEAWRLEVGRRLQCQFPHADAVRAVAAWSEPAGALDPTVFALVRACRQRVPVALLTNATSRLPRDLERLGLSDAFDHVINSSAVGAAKPNPTIFHTALQTLGLPASQVLYIDDSPGHVEAASRLGVIGHVYRGHDALRQVLLQHGLLPYGAQANRPIQ